MLHGLQTNNCLGKFMDFMYSSRFTFDQRSSPDFNMIRWAKWFQGQFTGTIGREWGQ